MPTTRLLIVFSAVIVPAAALTAWPSWRTQAFLAILAAIALALLDPLLSRRALSGIRVEGPELVRLWNGRPGEIGFPILNQSGRSRRVRIGFGADPEIGLSEEERWTRLPAASRLLDSRRCVPSARGRYGITGYAIEARSWLGLWAFRARRPLAIEVRVYPDAASQRSSPAFMRRSQPGIHSQRQLGRGREFEKLRDYTAGDGFDEIDWKATARRGRPITRVFQVERTQEVYAVLDASRLMSRPSAGPGSAAILERNITATLLLALEAEKQGDRFGLLTFSDRVHGFVRARSGKAHYGACRETLYTLQPRIVSPDFDEVCSLLRLRLQRRALLIFLTELDDPAIAESFLRDVHLIRRKHVVLVGMMQPPASGPLFEGALPLEADQIYDRLAGHLEWRRLRTLSQVLKRQGIYFALLQPETGAAQLAAAYMSLKRRQVL